MQTFVLGGAVHPWESGGHGRDPEVLVGERFNPRVDTTNAPGNAIEFAHQKGWISSRFFEKDVNIASLVLEEGGAIRAPNLLSVNTSLLDKQLEGTVNGDHLMAFERKPTPFQPQVATHGIWIVLDFGRRVGVHRIRFYPRNTVVATPKAPFDSDFLRAYEVWINDQETSTVEGAPDRLVVRQVENEEPVVDVAVKPQYVRLVKVRSLSESPFEIDEIEVYGTGYLEAGAYLSDLIDLDDRSTVGPIRWAEETVGEAPFSRLSVRARTGDDDTIIVYRMWVDSPGGGARRWIEVSGDLYWAVERYRRGVLEEDTENWSPWTAVEPGGLVTAPVPRRYLQFQLQFEGGLFATREVGELAFDYLQPPVADTLRAEVFPRLAEAEKPATFRYAVLLRANGPVYGYDELEVDTNVAVARIRQLKIDGEPADFAVKWIRENGFRITFPRIEADGSVLEFTFDLPIFRFGTTFSGRAINSRFAGVPQRLEPGQAVRFAPTDEDELSGLSVAIPKEQIGKLVGEITLSGRVLTPNGDGVNDSFEIFFSLLQLLHPAPVSLEIFDLTGRRVHTVFAEERRIGPAKYTWDGRLGDGRRVPPGNYVWVLRVKADAFEERHSGVMAVAY